MNGKEKLGEETTCDERHESSRDLLYHVTIAAVAFFLLVVCYLMYAGPIAYVKRASTTLVALCPLFLCLVFVGFCDLSTCLERKCTRA